MPPLVRAGIFGEMPPSKVVVLVGAGLCAVVTLLGGLPQVAPLPLLAGGVIAFKRVGGYELHELIPLKASWWWRKRRKDLRWFRPVPMLAAGERSPAALPAVLRDLELLDVDVGWAAPGRLAGAAVIHDRATGIVTAVIRAHGDGQFSLASADEQDARVAMWGDAITGFCRENPEVVRVAWHEWTAADGVDEHVDQIKAMADNELAGEARRTYLQLVEQIMPISITHETLVCVSVDVSRVRVRRRQETEVLASAIETVLEELRLFCGRLEAAGLCVDPVLSPAEVTTALRKRSDPNAIGALNAQRRSLAADLGVSAEDFAPMAVAEEWGHVRVDGSVHRSYWVEGWPRLEVPAAWMDPLLLGMQGNRTVTVVFEPIAPSAAAHEVDSAVVALEATEANKEKNRTRIRAAERRRRAEVEQREEELVAGYGALACVGLVTLTAATEDELDDLAADCESAAGHAGVQLRPLEGRHAQGWVASMPLGRSIATRREMKW
ncbi:MAG: hypothetical protein M3Q30_01710 [Actinomycetota bacterium]|nr:hypothetical protein [Actinomycetota bacterium]